MKEKWVQGNSDRWYKVIEESETEIRVEDIFEFAQDPAFRKLKMWWAKELCHIIEIDSEGELK